MKTAQAIASLEEALKLGDETMGSKSWTGGSFESGAVRRLLAVNRSHGELFDAASTVMKWMMELPVDRRPVIKFNRLMDALNGVREATQMDMT